MRKIAIIWQIVCIILNVGGMIVGVVCHSLALLLWSAVWGYFSCVVIDKLRKQEEEENAIYKS